MAETEKQDGSLREEARAVPVMPAPTRSQVIQAGRAPEGAQAPPAAQVGDDCVAPGGPAQTDVKTTPEVKLAGDIRPPPEGQGYGRRRGDNAPVACDASPTDDGDLARPAQRDVWRSVAVAALIALILVCFMLVRDVHHPAKSAVDAGTAMSGVFTGGATQSESPGQLPAESDQAMTSALEDFDAALEGKSGRSPEELLREVSGPGRDCGMVWTNDRPSIVFGASPIGANSLANTLEACAKAVSRLH